MSFARSNRKESGMTVDKYLRIKQVAELTGLSRATIYNMEKAGTFPEKTHLGKRAVAWRISDRNMDGESAARREKRTRKTPRPAADQKLKPIDATTATIENTPPRTGNRKCRCPAEKESGDSPLLTTIGLSQSHNLLKRKPVAGKLQNAARLEKLVCRT